MTRVDAFERDDVTSVLLWAAGSDCALADDLRPDEDELLRLVDLHALTARLVHRLGRKTNAWLTPRLREALSDLDLDTRRKAAAHMEAAAEIIGKPAAGEPVIIKGVSTSLVTGLPQTLRCGDIDLVCQDGAAATDVMHGLGYRRTRDPFMHEIGEFTRGNAEVDLHAHFPVHGYTGLARDNLRPMEHPETWVQAGYRMSTRRIEWSLLHAHSVERQVASGGRVLVPRPELLAIILSAHGFMNFTNVWSISHREKPYVRLGELADLRDLAATPRFDGKRFARLVQDLGASDAVSWASWAFETLIGPGPLVPVHRSDLATYPRCLWWGWWAEVAVGANAWLQTDWYDMARVANDLGANAVTIDGGSTPLLLLNGPTALSRQLRLEPNQDLGPVGIQFDDNGSTVTVVLPERAASHVERIRVDFGSVASECQLTSSPAEWRASGSHVHAHLEAGGGRRELTLRFDERVRSRHVLFGLAQEDDHGRHTAGALVPIVLHDPTSAVDSPAP